MSALNQYIFKSGSISFSYWSSVEIDKMDKSKPVIICFPPGATSGDYFNRVPLPVGFQIVALDYPARGKTPTQKDNSVEGIAKTVGEFIKSMEFENISISAISYGTAIATKLVQSNKIDIKEITLRAPGEFLDKRFIPLYKLLFVPSRYSELVRRLYRRIVLKHRIAESFPTQNLKDIMEQAIGIMDYEIDTNKQSDIPCRMILYSKDRFVRDGSIEKVKTVFPNHQIEYAEGVQDHLADI